MVRAVSLFGSVLVSTGVVGLREFLTQLSDVSISLPSTIPSLLFVVQDSNSLFDGCTSQRDPGAYTDFVSGSSGDVDVKVRTRLRGRTDRGDMRS